MRGNRVSAGLGLMVFLMCSFAGFFGTPAVYGADHMDFAHKVAGTYYLIVTEQSKERQSIYGAMLTLFADGNVSCIQALQYGLGIEGFVPFSNQHGAWKKTAEQQVTARVLDFAYIRADGTPKYTCPARIVIQFDTDFQKVSGVWEGACYEPLKVNPLAPGDASPKGTFKVTFEGERITVEDCKK